ncbi:hypothetical protein GF362_04970 [Candidatus Dojkabacteria bacterium]|nr:hypothetical protein [Candidatus Dojkabacteria bacterium]
MTNASETGEKKPAIEKQKKNAEDSKKTWIDQVFSSWLKKDEFIKKQKRIENKIRKAKEEANQALGNFNQEFRTKVKKLSKEDREKPARVLEELNKVSEEIQELSKKISTLEGSVETQIYEERIKDLQNLHKRIEREVQDKTEKTKQLEKIKQREAALYLRELHRNDHSEIARLDSSLLGMKYDLLQQTSQLEDIAQINEPLYQSLREYHNKLNVLQKQEKIGEKTLETPDILSDSDLKQRIERDRKRYQRTAEIKSLREKLSNLEDDSIYLSPNMQLRYLKLLRESLRDAIESNGDSPFVEDRVLAEIFEDLQVNQNISTEKIENELEKINLVIQAHEQSISTKLEDVKDVELRQKIIKNHAILLSSYIGIENPQLIEEIPDEHLKQQIEESRGRIQFAESIEQATNYEKQLRKRFDAIAEQNEQEGLNEFIHGLEEMQLSYMKEYESLRKMEREGPIEQREQLAKTFIRRRIMDEFSDISKIKALYGDKYATIALPELDFGSRKKEMNDFQQNLLAELELKYNISSKGMNYEEMETLPEDREKANRKAQEIYTDISTQLEDIIQNQITSQEIISTIEKNPEYRHRFESSIKQDIKIARIKSELKNQDLAGLSNENMNQILRKIEGHDSENLDALLSEFGITLKQDNLQNLRDSFTNIENLFEEDLSTRKPKYEIIATPNGLSIAFNEVEELNKSILGNQETQYLPETLAVTLKSADTFQQFANTDRKENLWNGNIIIIGSNAGQVELSHEVQHAVLRNLKSEKLAPKYAKFNDTVEELAINLATGALWDELVLDKEIQNPQRISLAALAYVTPDSLGKEDEFKLYKILEYSKRIAQEEINVYQNGKLGEIAEQDIFGEIIADILISNIDKEGRYNLDAALEQIELHFQNDENYQFNLAEINQRLHLDQLRIQDYFGLSSGEPIPEDLIEKYQLLQNNPGFEFNVVAPMDTRGRANIAFDHKMGDRGKKSKAATENPMEVDMLSAAEAPFPLGPIFNLFTRLKKKPDPGPIEYHVSRGLGSLGGPKNFFNYYARGRGWGGIIRKLYDVPIIGPITKAIIPEPMTKFGSSSKILADIPPFGKAFDQISKDLFPGFNKWLKEKFPGRPPAYEAITPHASEWWEKQIQVMIANLGPEGIGLSGDEIQRIMGELPGIKYDFENGRLKFEKTRHNMEEIDEEGMHRGRIKQEFINDVIDTDRYVDDTLSISTQDEVGELAKAMHEAYDRDNYAYTMNDLITASHISHDLGINAMNPRSVRNEYYETTQGGEWTEMHHPEFGLIRKSDHIWYSLEEPDRKLGYAKRGVVINVNGEEKFFTLNASHELMRRYNLYHIDKTLQNGLPPITIRMQENRYEPNPNARVFDNFYGIGNFALNEDLLNNRNFISDPRNQKILSKYGSIGNFGRFELSDNYAWYYEPKDQKHYVHEVRRRRDTGEKIEYKFYNPTAYKMPLPNIEGDEKIAENWRRKTEFDFFSVYDGLKEQYQYLDEFVQRCAEYSRYERKAYYAMTFWECFKWWIQKFGGAFMIGSVIGAAITGAPLYAGIFLTTLALQTVGSNIAQYKWQLQKVRRGRALKEIARMISIKGMYDPLIKGETLSRLDRWFLLQQQSTNEAMMEDIAKEKIPEGSFDSDDLANKIIGSVFGKEGMIMKALSGAG